MTLQEVKNKIAQQYGFPDWWSVPFEMATIEQAMRDEVAMVYARAKWDEACESIRKDKNNKTVMDAFFDLGSNPQFKP